MVRVFACGAMVPRIDPPWWTHRAISHSSQCSMNGLTEERIIWMMHIKEPLLLIGKGSPCDGSGFPLLLSEWSFTICLTPYNRK